MKIKNLTVFSILTAVLCTAVRTATLLYVTEEKTGFFKSKLSGMGIFLSVAIFSLAAIAIIFAFSAKEKPITPYKPSVAVSVMMIIFGVTVFLSVFLGGNGLYSASWQKTAEGVTAIFAAGWLIVFGISSFKKINIPPVLATLPCLHFIIRLIIVFTDFSTSALVGEHVFSLSYHTLVMLFTLFFARLVSGYITKKHTLLFFPLGVATLIFSFTSVISRIIVSALGKKHLIHGETAVDAVGTVLCVLLVVLLLDIFKEKTAKEISQEEEKENAV